jgi:hypothetical protein
MANLRWYDASIDATILRSLAKAMLADEYTSKRSWGFRVTERRPTYVIGSYHERVTRTDEVSDPFGHVVAYTRVEFRSVEFVLRTTYPAVELRDVGHSTGELFSRLAGYLDHDIVLTSIRPDVVRWLHTLEERGRVEVLALEIADLALSASASAVIRVEGVSDVRTIVDRFVGKRSHRVRRALIRWSAEEATTFEIMDLGRATFKQGQSAGAENALRETLAMTRQT